VSNNGNTIVSNSSYTMSNGKTGDVADVTFAYNANAVMTCPFNAEPQQGVQAAAKKTSLGVL